MGSKQNLSDFPEKRKYVQMEFIMKTNKKENLETVFLTKSETLLIGQ